MVSAVSFDWLFLFTISYYVSGFETILKIALQIRGDFSIFIIQNN